MGNPSITQKYIADNMKELLRHRTLEKITVKDICEQTGIDRRTFYRYFKDKYDVVSWIYYNDFYKNLARYADWNIWDYFQEIQRQMYTDRAFYLNAFRYRGQNSFRDYGKTILMELIHDDFDNLFTSPKEQNFFIEHALDMCFDGIEAWLSMSPCPPPEEFCENYMKNYLAFCTQTAHLIESSNDKDRTT